tara:strand:- start:2322 stop:2687 length:366 start_codon:yes stop_codon:yes gene_type:complete
MGFATNDQGGFSLDITLSPTFTGASTLGTSDCKDWDYSKHERIQYLETQWTFLSEEASQGKGENLIALAQMMGCTKERQTQFAVLLRHHYFPLFKNTDTRSKFLLKLETLLTQNPSLSCSG